MYFALFADDKLNKSKFQNKSKHEALNFGYEIKIKLIFFEKIEMSGHDFGSNDPALKRDSSNRPMFPGSPRIFAKLNQQSNHTMLNYLYL